MIHDDIIRETCRTNLEQGFRLLVEKFIEIINSVDNECKDFGEYKDWFMEHYLPEQ